MNRSAVRAFVVIRAAHGLAAFVTVILVAGLNAAPWAGKADQL